MQPVFFRYSEAELTLAGNVINKQKTLEEIESEFGNLASHVFSLLGAIYSKTERLQKATECYRISLKLNPLLWSSYERLCQLGEYSKHYFFSFIFSLDGFGEMTVYCCSVTHYHTIPNFDALKIHSCRKHCEERRNCL